ncbi:MAG: hypothetical protein IJN25_08930 [Clostridia bacterium]|nr:hypothetical protein [Oscillospiraceae bacterium]MBQ7033765.1 hypothetical protein [Clostridia bacterium]
MWKSDKLQNFLSKKKNISLLYIIVSICILLLAFWGCTPEKEKETAVSSSPPDVPALTQVLETILSGIEGVDGVQVAVTYESGTETVPLADIDGESRTVVTLGSGSSETVVTAKEIMPRVRGVVVVAGGAENARVRENLLSAAQALTGAPVHSIAVFPAKKQN